MKKKTKIILNIKNSESGFAMMIAVLFFVATSVFVVLGLTGPSAREYRTATDSLLSKQSYFLAESGSEDAFYRVKNSKHFGSTINLVLGSYSTSTAINAITGGYDIKSLANVISRQRSVNIKALGGSTVSLKYGAETGGGGVYLGPGTPHILGDVYANGPIKAEYGSNINGTATSTTSGALTLDQTNGTGTPAYDISFGNSVSTEDIAQSFKVSTLNPINKIQLYVKKVGSPASATITIRPDGGGVPSTFIAASGTLVSSGVLTDYSWVNVNLTSHPLLDVGTTYWIVVDITTSSTDYYVTGAVSGYAGGVGIIGQLPSTWNNTTPFGLDFFFNVYLGGINGLIQTNGGSLSTRFAVGSAGVGDARAHTVNYVSVAGTIYCTSGTGNNKPCTSAPDTVTSEYSMPTSMISQWKTDALAGGEITSSYSVSSSGVTIGPKKIDGNLSVMTGGTLHVSGTLWITGNLVVSGSSRIALSSGYAGNSGIIVVDGTISGAGISGFLNGSGTSGSYLVLVDTSYSSSAISLNSGSGTVILYAPYGSINLSSNIYISQATGYQINVSNGATLSYSPTLNGVTLSSSTTSTPTGFSIGDWRETQ